MDEPWSVYHLKNGFESTRADEKNVQITASRRGTTGSHVFFIGAGKVLWGLLMLKSS
jgi:hypothetical protein